MSHWVLTTESIHTFRDDLRQRLGSRRASFIAHKIHFHRALVAKIGEFIGRGKAPKNKVCVFLGTSTRHWRPLCLCRWAWAAGGAFAGRQGTKNIFWRGLSLSAVTPGSAKLFYQLALAGCHPVTRMVLLANFWGKGVL